MARMTKRQEVEYFINRAMRGLEKVGQAYVFEMQKQGKNDDEIERFLLSSYFETYVSLVNLAKLMRLEELEKQLIADYENLTKNGD